VGELRRVEIPQELLDDGTVKSVRSGKVRDIIETENQLLLVATDRISAFDVIMPNLIPDKGKVLTQISRFWFSYFPQIPNHATLLDDDTAKVIGVLGLHGANNYMACHKANVVPIEFVVRGYIAGSMWREHADALAGKPTKVLHSLDHFAQQCQELPLPIFTPATKAEQGQHDENITVREAADICAEYLDWKISAARHLVNSLGQRSISMYSKARQKCISAGLILADTKFEFGMRGDNILLIDEIFTPDSSRYWPLADYEPGRDQDSFDKQILRNYLEGLVQEGKWDKTAPGPELPDDLVQRISNRYKELWDKLTL